MPIVSLSFSSIVLRTLKSNARGTSTFHTVPTPPVSTTLIDSRDSNYYRDIRLLSLLALRVISR